MDISAVKQNTRRNRGEILESVSEKIAVLTELAPCYQKAFAGSPWYEVSRCTTCVRGFSGQKVGEICKGCGDILTNEAYPTNELIASISKKIISKQSVVYIERGLNGDVELGAIAFQSNPLSIYESSYKRKKEEHTPLLEMLLKTLPPQTIWLDDIMADLEKQSSGNLAHFEAMCEDIFEHLDLPTIGFRSINIALVKKAVHTFTDRCQVVSVPDRGTESGTSFLVTIAAE